MPVQLPVQPFNPPQPANDSPMTGGRSSNPYNPPTGGRMPGDRATEGPFMPPQTGMLGPPQQGNSGGRAGGSNPFMPPPPAPPAQGNIGGAPRPIPPAAPPTQGGIGSNPSPPPGPIGPPSTQPPGALPPGPTGPPMPMTTGARPAGQSSYVPYEQLGAVDRAANTPGFTGGNAMPWAAANPNLPWQHFTPMLQAMLTHLTSQGGQGAGGGRPIPPPAPPVSGNTGGMPPTRFLGPPTPAGKR